MNAEIVWRPQPRQAEFMRRPEPEALYGGAAGGGKSDALVIEALRQVHIPHYRGLILRKTYPQLSDLVDKSMAYYKRAFPTAQYNATSHVWVFPSGAKIYFGSMQYTKDRTNYQGKAFDFIGFDELTHFEWEEYSYMMSRNRPTGPGTRVYLRATTNPGGVGHGWVKARFITPAPPGTPIVEQFPVRMPDGTEKVLERARVFIPSSVFDNPALLENDPDYLASLASLPEAEKQALLYGSWDSFSGQVFTEWRNDPGHYQDQRWTHVIAPFAIPRHWKIYRGYDFGFSKPFSVGWYAADEEGRLYRIKELYGCTGRPNEGLRIDPVEQARRIREAEQNDPMLKGRTILSTGKGTTPEYVLRYLLTSNGLDPDKDVDIQYYSEATEVTAQMAATQDAIAVLPQPYVTAAGLKDDTLRVALDLTAEWDKVADTQLITGVTVVRKAYAEEHPDVVAAFLADYAQSVNAANTDLDGTAALCEEQGVVAKAAIAKKALPNCNIVCLTGEELKADVSGYLQVLYDADPAAVGGTLPGEDFYWTAQ